MIYLLYVIITLMVAIVYSLQQRIWQEETYNLKNKYPEGKNKSMDKLLFERDQKMGNMVWSQFVYVIAISAFISLMVFVAFFSLQSFGWIEFFEIG